MFCFHTNLKTAHVPWKDAINALRVASDAWEYIESEWFYFDKDSYPDIVAEHAVGSVSASKLCNAKDALHNAMQTVQYAAATRIANLRIWKSIRSRVQASSWEVMLLRTMGKPYSVPDRKEARERAMYTTLHVEKSTRFFLLWGVEEHTILDEIKTIEKIFANHYGNKCSSYNTHYANV